MKKTLKFVAAAAMLAVTAGAAQAQTLSYSTQYSCTGLNDFSATVTCSYPSGVDLMFAGQPVTSVDAPTFADFGTVTASNLTATGFTFSGQNVFVRVLQTTPTSGQFTFTGTLTGSIASNSSSTASIAWSPATGSIGVVNYNLEANSLNRSTSINAPSSGPQTVRDFVTATPEPASMVLLGTGLLGVFGVATRRKKA